MEATPAPRKENGEGQILPSTKKKWKNPSNQESINGRRRQMGAGMGRKPQVTTIEEIKIKNQEMPVSNME